MSAPLTKYPLMKCIGLTAGVTTPVFETYWQTIRRETQKEIGADQMPRFIFHCTKPQRLQSSFVRGDWKSLTKELAESGLALQEAGADCIVICGSAMNTTATDVSRALQIPVIDFGLSVAMRLQHLKYTSVGVLGIGNEVEEQMWRRSLKGVQIILPSEAEREWLSRCSDRAKLDEPVLTEWKVETNRIIASFKKQKVEAVLLADPVLSKWIKPGRVPLVVIDAAEVHAWIAALWAMCGHILPAPGCVAQN